MCSGARPAATAFALKCGDDCDRYTWFQGTLLQNDEQERMKLVQVSGLKSGGSSKQTCMGMLVQMAQAEYATTPFLLYIFVTFGQVLAGRLL